MPGQMKWERRMEQNWKLSDPLRWATGPRGVESHREGERLSENESESGAHLPQSRREWMNAMFLREHCGGQVAHCGVPPKAGQILCMSVSLLVPKSRAYTP